MKTLKYKKLIFIYSVVFFGSFFSATADTVAGNGYILQQIITPIQDSVSGNGYTVGQTEQLHEEGAVGNGYILQGGLSLQTGSSTVSHVTPPSDGTVRSGGGYYVIVRDNSNSQTVTPMCTTRVTFSAPIEIGSSLNKKEDVQKLERFLNVYENESLSINGIYEVEDVAAVKRWQKKYKNFILDPIGRATPTGTVYALSQRQIERQTTKECGSQVVVMGCPFFAENISFGSRNDSVKRVQQFLNLVRKEKVPIGGVYGPLTRDAVKRFQKAYKKELISFFGYGFASGDWNEKTRMKANQIIGCDILK